jgi:glycosyltransferase involved in cell wall biosynthesis
MKHAFKLFEIGSGGLANSGGLERYFFELTRALVSAGIETTGLAVGAADGACDGSPNIRPFGTASDSLLRRWALLKRVAPQMIAGADLVVSHFAPYAFPILNDIRRKPYAIHFQGPWALESKAHGARPASVFFKTLIEKRVYHRAARFVVLSKAFGEILSSRYGIDSSLIRVVRGGVNVERFQSRETRADARGRLGLPQDRPIVLTARRLVASKGVENLVDAISTVRVTVPDVLLLVLGTGPLAGEIQRRITERDLAKNVRLLGHVSDDDLAATYRAADLFVVPSVAFEGFGLVAVEALASGTPTLVTNVGGLPEAVGGLDTALVLQAADSATIARGINAILTGAQRVPDEVACTTYANDFRWESVARDVADVYAEVI